MKPKLLFLLLFASCGPVMWDMSLTAGANQNFKKTIDMSQTQTDTQAQAQAGEVSNVVSVLPVLVGAELVPEPTPTPKPIRRYAVKVRPLKVNLVPTPCPTKLETDTWAGIPREAKCVSPDGHTISCTVRATPTPTPSPTNINCVNIDTGLPCKK